MEKHYKQFLTDVSESAPRKMSFTISTASVDRDGDTIDPKGWQLDNFMKNPVVLFGHDYSSLPIGKAVNITATDKGLQADVEFPPVGTYPFADTVHDMVKTGFLNATSVGFAGIEVNKSKDREYGYDFAKQELLEFSIVPVPANPEALVQRGLEETQVKVYAKTLMEWAEAKEPRPIQAIRKAGYGHLLTDEHKGAVEKFSADYEVESDGGKKAVGKERVEKLLAIHDLIEKKEKAFDPQVIIDEVLKRLDERIPKGDISSEVIDIQTDGPDIAWDLIEVKDPEPEFDAEEINQMLLTATRESLRELVGAQAQAAINKMTGRID